MRLALDHVQVAFPAGRESDADAFYVGALGFTNVPKPSALAARGGRWYECDGVQVHLGSDANFVVSARAHVALRCDDVDTLRTRLLASGARVEDDHELAGVTRFYTWDPFGNRIEVIAS